MSSWDHFLNKLVEKTFLISTCQDFIPHALLRDLDWDSGRGFTPIPRNNWKTTFPLQTSIPTTAMVIQHDHPPWHYKNQ